MAIYYIGKSERDFADIKVFAGSETIYGTNENENYAMFSLADEDKKELSEKQMKLAFEALRMGMEKFKLFDEDATFVFSDKQLMNSVMKITATDFKVTDSNIKLVENLSQYK